MRGIERATKIHFTKFMCGSGSGHTSTHTHAGREREISRYRNIKKIKYPEPGSTVGNIGVAVGV